jgi:organic hydroperoxide reductase OsmC/OhrA
MSDVQKSEVQWRPECAVCKKSVEIHESMADEGGQAIHEECYVSKITSGNPPVDSMKL